MSTRIPFLWRSAQARGKQEASAISRAHSDLLPVNYAVEHVRGPLCVWSAADIAVSFGDRTLIQR